MHHGDVEGEAIRRVREELDRVAREHQLGATGQFPEGKLTPEDEGEIQLAVGTHEGKVVIHFGEKPVKWIGLSPRQARELAESIRQASYRATDGEAKK